MLKRCLRDRDFKTFENEVVAARKISKLGKVGRTPYCLINRLADIKEIDKKNLLHLAAGIAANEDDPRFFVRLLDLRFPLYSADVDLNYPAFLLCSIDFLRFLLRLCFLFDVFSYVFHVACKNSA